MQKFDVCIIGAGPAGYKVAMELAKNGKKVSLIELDPSYIGGTCLNEGCIPTKNYIESASYIKKFSYFQNHGINGNIENFDILKLKSQTISLLDGLRNGLKAKLEKLKIELIYGKATFISKDEIEISETKKRIQADKFIIATGSSHKEHPTLKVDEKYIISSREVFKLEEIPKKILIIGAGAIGCEFANFFNALESEVHLVEFTPQILPLEDEDVAKIISREFKKQKIKVETSTNALSYTIKEDSIYVELENKKDTIIQKYDKVLISIGRVPNTLSLNLSKADVETDSRGFIMVDKNLQTTNENIYAIGDTIATPALAHQAYYEAHKVAQYILYDDSIAEAKTPNVTFTTPQVASVGKNEKLLKELNIKYNMEKIFFKSFAMPKIKGDDSGFLKLLLDEDKKRILGCSIVGYDATEIINQIAIILNKDISIKEIKSMIFAHPTISESLHELIKDI